MAFAVERTLVNSTVYGPYTKMLMKKDRKVLTFPTHHEAYDYARRLNKDVMRCQHHAVVEVEDV